MRIASKALDIKVTVQMSRSSSYDGEDGTFTLRIEDEASTLIIAEIKLNEYQFANLMSTRLGQGCDAKLYMNDKIGKRHECITVNLVVSEPTLECLNKACEKWQDDNANFWWILDTCNEFNHHKYNGKTYTVIARRYLDIAEAKKLQRAVDNAAKALESSTAKLKKVRTT